MPDLPEAKHDDSTTKLGAKTAHELIRELGLAFRFSPALINPTLLEQELKGAKHSLVWLLSPGTQEPMKLYATYSANAGNPEEPEHCLMHLMASAILMHDAGDLDGYCKRCRIRRSTKAELVFGFLKLQSVKFRQFIGEPWFSKLEAAVRHDLQLLKV